jgi:hypothetical protein
VTKYIFFCDFFCRFIIEKRGLVDKLLTNEEIIHFIQDQLGCQCSSEVFSHIECKSDMYIGQENRIPLKYRINIGNRLLVYVFTMENATVLNEMLNLLRILLNVGIQDRNQNLFNRFRLVFLGKIFIKNRKELEKLFMESTRNQDKVHLHFIEKIGKD